MRQARKPSIDAKKVDTARSARTIRLPWMVGRRTLLHAGSSVCCRFHLLLIYHEFGM